MKKKLYFLGHHKEWSMILTDIISQPLAKFVVRFTPFTANQISVFSFFLILVAAYYCYLGGYTNILIGSLLAFTYNVLDLVDGVVARKRNQSSILGQWLDGAIGFISFQIIIIALAIGLQNTIALILGMIAIISYPTQYNLVYYFKADIVPKLKQEEAKQESKIMKLRYAYGSSFFYVMFPILAAFGKAWWVLIFFATLGNLYWILVIIIQYLQIKRNEK